MRIGIDARELLGRPTGVGRYLGALLARWSREPGASAHEVVLFTHAPVDTQAWRGQGGASIATRVVPGHGGTAWEQVALARAVWREPLDVFFGPGYSAPLAVRTPTVITLHDVSFFAHPEWFPWREGLRRRWLARAAARRARLVLTVTEFSRREIVEHLGLAASKVLVIHQGVDNAITGPDLSAADGSSDAPRERHKAPPVVLYAGSIFNRRRVSDLIEGVAVLARSMPDVRLEIVGENRTHPRQDLEEVARRSGIVAKMTLRDYVPDAELAALYRRAGVFAFLSEYEGFGLTPLEAVRAGVPVVLLDTPVAREVYGEAALYVRPGDADGVARALGVALTDEEARSRLLAAGGQLRHRYTWDATARLTLAALAEAPR